MNKRLITILAILFIGAFWWGGGSTFVGSSLPSGKQVEQASSDFKSAWHRLDRLIFLRGAVSAKLDKKNYTRLNDIPVTMQQAIIAVEDSRYYQHFGFDIEGILRAALVNLQTGSISEGGSTITQQLARNLFLTQERSIGRKTEEVFLAIDLEMHYSKEEILEMYLNTVYFGSGNYGIGPAAANYFGKEPAKLNLAECSMLAGLPNAPSLISPYVNFAAAKQRQAIVLSTMTKSGFIGPSMAEEAKKTPIRLAQ